MKKKIWYEFCPGCAFKGIILKTKKTWLFGVIHLVLWRNDLVKKPYCSLEWMHNDLVFDRNLI
jgi:hypothetical protein